MSSIAATKATIRKEVSAKLAALSTEERQRQSDLIQTAVLNSSFYQSSRHISLYLSLPKEVSTGRIVDNLLSGSNKFLYVPDVMHSGGSGWMNMLQVMSKTDLSHFEKKELNVLSPTHDVVRVDPLADQGEGLDLIIFPGIAFDKKGGRLGRGKGYYDKYVAAVRAHHRKINKPMPKLVGLAFNEQVLDEVPVDDTDARLDEIIYPDGIRESDLHSFDKVQ